MSDADSSETPEEKKARRTKARTEYIRQWRKRNPESTGIYYRRKRDSLTPEEKEEQKRIAKEEMRRWRQENPEASLENSRANHRSHRQYDRDRAKTHLRKNQAFLKQILRQVPCSRCGMSDYRCLLFHHRDTRTKKMEMARVAAHSRKRLLDELEKCDVVCHNCHLRLHAHDGKVKFWEEVTDVG